MDWSGVMWIILMFWLSFWRHPFTAKDPLVSKWRNATFLHIFSNEETNSSISWMAWGLENVQHIPPFPQLFLK